MLNLDDDMDALPTYRNGYLGFEGPGTVLKTIIVRAFHIISNELYEDER